MGHGLVMLPEVGELHGSWLSDAARSWGIAWVMA